MQWTIIWIIDSVSATSDEINQNFRIRGHNRNVRFEKTRSSSTYKISKELIRRLDSWRSCKTISFFGGMTYPLRKRWVIDANFVDLHTRLVLLFIVEIWVHCDKDNMRKVGAKVTEYSTMTPYENGAWYHKMPSLSGGAFNPFVYSNRITYKL